MKITLKEQDVETVLQALAQQPYRTVAVLIEDIIKQAREQSQPKEKAAE
jgi:hypothetical protein